MSQAVNLPLILAAGFVSTASPGPAILAISATSLKQGRGFGLALAAGVTCGSLIWSASAAAGLGVAMLANAWVFETIRLLGALYLAYLAIKAARSALSAQPTAAKAVPAPSRRAAYLKGLLLHLTNPKPILFFGALYGLGVPPETGAHTLGLIVLVVGLQSAAIFHGYALLFSHARIAQGYARLRRGFEAAFALAFGAAAWRLLTARVHS